MTGGDWGPHLAVRETPDPRPGLVGLGNGPKTMDARGALHVPWKMWMSGENHGKSIIYIYIYIIYIYIYVIYIVYIYIYINGDFNRDI